MSKFRKMNNSKTYRGVIVGIGFALLISLTTACITSGLMLRSVIDEKHVKFIIPIAQFLSVFISTVVAISRSDKKIALTAGIIGCGYYLLLIAMTLLLFDSTFAGLGVGSIMCVVGVLTAIIFGLLIHTKHKTKIRKL